MKSFTNYTAEDLATEPLFIKWVQQPEDHEVSNFWNGWVGRNPAKSPEVEEARDIVAAVSNHYENMSSREVRSVWRRIQHSVGEIPDIHPLQPNPKQWASSVYMGRWLFALFVFCVFVSWLVLRA